MKGKIIARGNNWSISGEVTNKPYYWYLENADDGRYMWEGYKYFSKKSHIFEAVK